MKRYRQYPAVDAALVETRAAFNVREGLTITEEHREIAERFDVDEALEKAKQLRKDKAKTTSK